MRRYNLVLE